MISSHTSWASAPYINVLCVMSNGCMQCINVSNIFKFQFKLLSGCNCISDGESLPSYCRLIKYALI